jgi:hypothetical protein
MSTRFNGFGDTLTVAAADQPWPSLFAEPTARVVRLDKAARRGK